MKSKLGLFYGNYFIKQRKFIKKYFSTEKSSPIIFKRPKYNFYLAGAKQSKKFITFLNKNKIKASYVETRKNSSIIPGDFIEYGCFNIKYNDSTYCMDIDCNTSNLFNIVINPSKQYNVYGDSIIKLIKNKDWFDFEINVLDENYDEVPVNPEICDILNSLKGSSYNIPSDLMFQYSLIHKDIEHYIVCAKILNYLYDEFKMSSKITAYTLYNISI
ncbi:hypothetical protein N0S44_000303 [Escherichia coli]|nr:hypothetical protein [Escherichia coli]